MKNRPFTSSSSSSSNNNNNARKLAPRALSTSVATATSGPVGASFAVVHKDWRCGSCNADNSGRYKTCLRCREGTRPEEAMVWHEGASTAVTRQDHGWREALDPETKQIYYINQQTQETTWERPTVMGPAPLNTGWFGRGSNQAGEQLKYEKKNEEYLSRPAAKQAEAPPTDSSAATSAPEGAGEFNIWYGRYQGQHWSKGLARGEKADSRCRVDEQAGYTKAGPDSPFCLWFARGQCHKGATCRFFHRIPIISDCGRLEKDASKDVFGRPRGTEHRDDMSGVSSIHDPSRTLYVSGLVRGPYEQNRNALEECVRRHFNEWGEIENVNVVWKLSIAFVRYRFRSNAEFAIEAMNHQSLDHEEILNVRWAYEDPNPVAKKAAERANADAVVAAIKATGANSEAAPEVKALMQTTVPRDADRKRLKQG
jgi:hypothetical protein